MSVLPLQSNGLVPAAPATREATQIGPRRRLRPPSWRWTFAAMLLLLAAGWGMLHIWHTRLRPLTVQTAPLSTDVPVQVFGLGTVGARVQSNIGFKVAGVLVTLNADQGDLVPAGSVLAKLDDRDVRAQLAAAHAAVAQADANIGKAEADVASAVASLANAEQISNRRATLARSGVASMEEAQTTDAAKRIARAGLTVAQTQVVVARAALLTAKAQEDYAAVAVENDTLIAPYDALVVSRTLQLGSMPLPGQSVFALVDPKSIWVLGYIDERLAGPISVGQPAQIVLRSSPEQRLPGHVARIEIQSDAVNQERLVEVTFDRAPADIHLAEQAEVFITTATLPRAVLVPPTLISERKAGRGTVWTLQDGRLQKREVTFGPELLDGRLPIVSGLPDDARVVVSPASGLTAGRTARLAEAAPR
jgi:HlyD family secretion protein